MLIVPTLWSRPRNTPSGGQHKILLGITLVISESRALGGRPILGPGVPTPQVCQDSHSARRFLMAALGSDLCLTFSPFRVPHRPRFLDEFPFYVGRLVLPFTNNIPTHFARYLSTIPPSYQLSQCDIYGHSPTLSNFPIPMFSSLPQLLVSTAIRCDSFSSDFLRIHMIGLHRVSFVTFSFVLYSSLHQ